MFVWIFVGVWPIDPTDPLIPLILSSATDEALPAASASSFIGVLDIFGFEHFKARNLFKGGLFGLATGEF